MSNTQTKSLLEKRANIISYIYGFELMGSPFSADQAFESGDFDAKDLKTIEAIAKNYDKFSKVVKQFLKGSWSWERIAPLERAILIYGAFELVVKDKALVINELITITKGFIPGDSYKFINAILENIGAYYDKIKSN